MKGVWIMLESTRREGSTRALCSGIRVRSQGSKVRVLPQYTQVTTQRTHCRSAIPTVAMLLDLLLLLLLLLAFS